VADRVLRFQFAEGLQGVVWGLAVFRLAFLSWLMEEVW